jgi:enoyl-CoA hydratase/carnithine racemase
MSAAEPDRDGVAFERVGVDGRIALITMNRPEVMNAYTMDTLRQMEEIWDEVRDNRSIWAAVLTGAGERAFSTGHDVRWMAGIDPAIEALRPEYYGGEHVRYFHGYGAYGFDIRKPVIAAIRGYCLGGGFAMACRCDIRIASDDAQFGVPQVRLGVISPTAAVLLPRLIGQAAAMEILLTGERFDAATAYRIGFVNRVVPGDQVIPEALAFAERICAAAPLAVQATKHVTWHSLQAPVEVALDMGHREFSWLRSTKDGREGGQAFIEKRAPEWKGE